MTLLHFQRALALAKCFTPQGRPRPQWFNGTEDLMMRIASHPLNYKHLQCKFLSRFKLKHFQYFVLALRHYICWVFSVPWLWQSVLRPMAVPTTMIQRKRTLNNLTLPSRSRPQWFNATAKQNLISTKVNQPTIKGPWFLQRPSKPTSQLWFKLLFFIQVVLISRSFNMKLDFPVSVQRPRGPPWPK